MRFLLTQYGMRTLLWVSLASLILSWITALSYEIYAVTTNMDIPISSIVIPWVKQHNLIASLIVGGVIGFLTFLILHFFGARANVR